MVMRWNFLQVFPFFLDGRPSEWYANLLAHRERANLPLSKSDLVAEFLDFYDPKYRDEAREAREKLGNDGCTMAQYSSVKEYEMEFKFLVRLANTWSVEDQILWFLRGLSPELREMCTVDANGSDWEMLHALICYALGAEKKLLARHASTKPPTKAYSVPITPQMGKRPLVPKGGNPAKKAKSSGGASGSNTGAGGSKKDGPVHPSLWKVCQANGWKCNGVPYTVESFNDAFTRRNCLHCARHMGDRTRCANPNCPASSYKPKK